MEDEIVTYKKYNNTSFIVNGQKEKHHKFIKTLSGRWNSKVKDFQAGWIVPIEKEKELKIYIDSLNVSKLNKNIKSRKKQNKYHRAISISSDSSDSSCSDSSDSCSDSCNDSCSDSCSEEIKPVEIDKDEKSHIDKKIKSDNSI